MMMEWVFIMCNFMSRSSAYKNINPTDRYQRALQLSLTGDYVIKSVLIW